MGNALLRTPDDLTVLRSQTVVLDDFLSYADTQLWTALKADTNTTAAHEGTAGGKSRLKIFTGDATDNNEVSVSLTNAIYKFVASRPMMFEELVQYAEGNTSAVNLAAGFANSFGANLIADNGGAIAVTDGALIFKKNGDTVWSFHTEINNSSTASTSTTTAGGTAAQRLRIEITPISATVFEARPFVDGVQLVTTAGVPIMHTITLGTATDMKAGLYLKAGSTTQETVYSEYLYAAQGR